MVDDLAITKPVFIVAMDLAQVLELGAKLSEVSLPITRFCIFEDYAWAWFLNQITNRQTGKLPREGGLAQNAGR